MARRPKEITMAVNYLVRIPIEKAEKIVGRPWPEGDAYLWECALEAKAPEHLPDLIAHAADDPDLEIY